MNEGFEFDIELFLISSEQQPTTQIYYRTQTIRAFVSVKECAFTAAFHHE